MRRVLATVVLALSAIVGLPATAHAGGPTSVLITHVGASAGALYYTDAEYDELVALLPDGETRGKGQPPGGGIDYNLTWMVHDVSIWRWDRVRVSTDGAWVATTFSGDSLAGWQQVESPARLAELLAAAQGREIAPTAAVAQDVEPASSPPSAAPGPDAAWFSLTGWRWMVPGCVLGLLVGAVAARRHRDEEPRRVLISSGA